MGLFGFCSQVHRQSYRGGGVPGVIWLGLLVIYLDMSDDCHIKGTLKHLPFLQNRVIDHDSSRMSRYRMSSVPLVLVRGQSGYCRRMLPDNKYEVGEYFFLISSNLLSSSALLPIHK